MPMTDNVKKIVDFITGASAAMNYLGKEESYREFAEADRKLLKEYLKTSLQRFTASLFSDTRVKNNKEAFVRSTASRIAESLHESSLEVSDEIAQRVAKAMMTEDGAAITDEVLDDLIDDPYALEALGSTLSEVAMDPDAFDIVLEDATAAPSLSHPAEVYVRTGNSIYDVIQNLRTSDELDEMREELEAGSYIRNNSEYFKNLYEEKQRRYDIATSYSKAINRDAAILESLLDGLTPLDGKAYADRLVEIVAYVSRTDVTKSVFTYTGTDRDKLRNVDHAARYVSELINRTSFLKDKRDMLMADIDFKQITESAREKAVSTDPADLQKKIGDIRKQAKSLEIDGSTLASRFENCESKEEIERAYAKVLDDVMNGKIELEGLGTDRLRGTQSDVARVNAYILRAAKSAGVNVELVSGDTIKKNCDRQLNGSDNARDMLCDFNEALNRFSVTGEELVELAVRKDETSKVYQTAVAKAEGLSRNADPRLLEDAVGVYARLKEVHEHRTLWQKISHPIRNYRENAAIKKMEATLVNDFGMSREQLDGARANALAVTDDPISREARKAENFERALEARKQAAQRSKERLDIIRNKIARINRPDVVKEAPAPQVNANPAAEKAKEKKELAENINRLKNFSEPQFKRFLNTALKEERKDLEKSARKHAKDGVITEAKKAEINQKVEDLKTELIQLHVDPKAYINDLNSHALDMKKSSMEKAVIEAVNNKETRERLKKEHKEHEEVRAENAQMIKEREELRVEYFKAAGLDERYDLDSAQRSAEDKTLLQMKEKMNFTSKLGADVSEKTEKKAPVQKDEPAVKQPVAEQSLEKK